MSQGRPRIQVVRLSSNERAKIHLDGVQLHAEFRHFRSGDYISATSVKDTGSCPAGSTEDETDDSSAADTKKRCYRFRRRKRRKRVSKSMETVASSELTTKSCDNIFHDAKKKKTRASPYVWKDATRSEEHLPKLERLGGLFHRGKAGRCASHDVFCFFGRTLRVDDKRINEEPDDFRASMTSQSLPTSPRGSRALQKSSTMPQARRTEKLSESGTRKKSRSATLTSFFKKLSPRLRRSGRHRDKPWIVVEFSRQDIEGSDSASVESDHSFELAVRTREALLEQQQRRAKESTADGNQQPQSSTTVAPSTTKKSEAAAKPSTKYKKSSAADEKQFLFKLSPKKVMHEVKQSLKNGRGRSNERNRSSTDSGKVTTNAATRTEDGRDSQVEPPERKHDVHFATPHIFIRSPDTSQASTSPEKADSTLESEGADPMKSDPFLRQGKGTPRPHTLSIRNKIVVRSPQMEKVAQKMASFESIGSCSLDADVTASESSEAVEGSVSQHTLHSVSIDMASQNSGRFKSSDANIQKIDNNHAEDQLSSPEYVKRTVKLFNSIAGSESVGSPGVHMNGGLKEPNLSNGNVKEEDESSMLKKPSYVGLSCSISGYTNITTYNSKLREGFRSRDHSPARFVLGANKSRDASPLRTDSQGNHLSNGVHPISKPEFGNRLVAPSLVLEVGSGSRGSSLDTSHMSISPIPKIVTVSDSETFTSECEVCVNGEQSGDSNVPEKKESPRKEETEKERLKVESDVKKERSPSHSPGAVRVVEFTSQTKSYVQTVMRSFSSTTSSSSSVEKKEYGRSLHSEISSVQSAIIENSMSTCNSDKSFIQQRIERLYGPGALAQGFFRKTRQLRTHDSEEIVNHKETSSLDSLSVNDAQQLRSKGSSPELPVLRHLRPEFREQLPVKPISTGKSSRKTHEIWSSSSETSEVGQEEETELPIAEVEAESKPIEPVVLVVEQPSEDAVDPTMCASVTKSQDSIPDLQPAAPEVVLPTQVLLPEPEVAEPSVAEGEKENERDGHYFLKLLKQETNRLDELVAQVEADLSANNLPEEASGKLRSASGQAQLLMRQKLQQFEGLCHKNIAQSPDEPFPTTSEDLAGFWDMVKLQIEHVDRLFEEISRLKKSNWVEDKQAEGDATASASTNSITKKRTLTKRPVSRQMASAKSTKASEASKAREEARRKMMEERRKAMKAQKEAAGGEDEVKIFVPESK